MSSKKYETVLEAVSELELALLELAEKGRWPNGKEGKQWTAFDDILGTFKERVEVLTERPWDRKSLRALEVTYGRR